MGEWRTLVDGRRILISNPREASYLKPERVVLGFSRGIFAGAPKKGSRKPSILTEQKSSAGETLCPVCGGKTYFVRASNGGSFWCDVLGTPWTPHPCMQHEKLSCQIRKVARNNLQLLGTVFQVITPDKWEKPNLVYIRTLDGSNKIIKTEASGVENLLGVVCGVMDTSIFSIEDRSSPVRLWKRNRLEKCFYDDSIDELAILNRNQDKGKSLENDNNNNNFNYRVIDEGDEKYVFDFYVKYKDVIDRLIYYLDMVSTGLLDEKFFIQFLHKQSLEFKIIFLKNCIHLFDSKLEFRHKGTERGLRRLNAVKLKIKEQKVSASNKSV